MAKKEPTEEIIILSVRNRRKSIDISWRQGPDKIDREFHENPLPSFLKAIEALAPHVCSLCELPAKDEEKIVATGITCREDGDNTRALIVARKKIKKGNRVFNISTPLLSMYEDSENKSADHMEGEQARAIEKVIKEAVKYIGGERAQGLINFPDAEDEEKKKGAKEDATAPLPGVVEDGPGEG